MLTKSDFLLFLDSPLHLWAKKNGKVEKEKDEFAKLISKQGLEVEKFAKLFIKKHISENFEYQKEFTTNSLKFRADFVIKNNISGNYDIYEVKSSTDVKLVHEYDVTFQYLVAQELVNIDNIFVIHINKDYTYKDSLNLSELFIIKNMNEIISKRKVETEVLIKQALDVTNLENPTDLESCYKPKDCICPKLCFPKLPQYSIYNLSNINKDRLIALRNKGILDLHEIPDTFPLGNRQKLQLISLRKKDPIIDKTKIQSFIDDIKFPIYYLDYESFIYPIPSHNGHKTYQNIVFQYSLHIQKQKDGELEHYEYISTSKDDPMKEIAPMIIKLLGKEGSIIVWNKLFEKKCNKEFGRIYNEFNDELIEINKRVIDLSDIFSKQYYVDYRFNGSWSIKNVLPVLVPEYSYKHLDINNGTSAMISWNRIMQSDINNYERDIIIRNLYKYCEMDTLAMYKILEAVKKKISF